MDAQADLSLRWAQMSEGTFSYVAAYVVKSILNMQANFKSALDIHLKKKK